MSINKNKELFPYYELAKKQFIYDPTTGRITRKSTGMEAGYTDSYGYKIAKISNKGKYKTLKLHRIAWFIFYGELPNIVNHKNHKKDDNRIVNLENVTHQENMIDCKFSSNNTSGFRGVTWSKKGKKWHAQITHRGNSIHIGSYCVARDASDAYLKKARELRGESYLPFE